MTRALLLLAALLPAGAVAADGRIATRLYAPSAIVPVHGRAGIQSTIQFAPDERIENVAVGDSASWQVTPNKRADLLFVKPMTARAHTNMTVVTDQRTYLFDLTTAGAAPVYMLRFTYLPEPKPAAPTPAQLAALATPPAPTPAAPTPAAPAPAAPEPTALHFAWASHGDQRLLPARVFDDGHMTYLAWPADTAVPAILAHDAAGSEGPVDYGVRGGYIVVDGVPAQLVLRLGKQSATLTPVPHAAVAGSADAATATAPGRPYAHVADGRP